MKLSPRTQDYAEFIILIKMNLVALEKAMNERRFDEANFLATELKVNAMLLSDVITKKVM